MKRITSLILVSLLSVVGISYGQSVPSVSTMKSSAGPGSAIARQSLKKMRAAPQGQVSIQIIPVRMTAIGSGPWNVAADQLIVDALAGKLKTSAPVNASDYSVITDRVIRWTDLVFSQTIPVWDEVHNPLGAYANGNGPVIQLLVIAESMTGQDDLSLLDLNIVVDPNDPDNLLEGGVVFRGQDYTRRAFVQKVDGKRIESGPSDQEGKMVVVIVQPPLFNGGDTTWGLNQVKNWFNTRQNFQITYTARVIGATSETRSVVSAHKLSPSTLAPNLGITANPAVGTVNLIVIGDRSRSYTIHVANSANGPWTVLRSVYGGNEIPVKNNGTSQFYRAVAQ